MDSREMRGASRWSAWWVRVGLAALVLTGIAPGTEAQETDSLFIKVGTLTRSDGGALDGPVSLDGDTAVVGTDGVVYVFTRTPALDNWHETATLVPSDGAAGFGRCLAIRGDTTIVGADGAAYVFRGAAGGQTWAEVAKLTGDTNAFSFGCGVAVSGPTIVIGAPVPDVIAGERGPGLAYVFE